MAHDLNVLPQMIERAKVTMRADVCNTCPYRSREATNLETPRHCEAECEFFQKIPELVSAGRCIDPMIGSFDVIMKERIREICNNLVRSAGGRRHYLMSRRERIVSDFAKIVGH